MSCGVGCRCGLVAAAVAGSYSSDLTLSMGTFTGCRCSPKKKKKKKKKTGENFKFMQKNFIRSQIVKEIAQSGSQNTWVLV